jgi:tetratricopeptide (TPR) repeat protein
MKPLKEITLPEGNTPEDEGHRKTRMEQIHLRMELGHTLSRRSRHGMALKALQQAALLKPDNPVPCLIQQAAALAEMQKFDAAFTVLEAAEKEIGEKGDSDPSGESPVPRRLSIDIALASILLEKGDYAESEGRLRQLLEIYPGHAGLLSQLGQCLLWTGKLDEAGDCFEKASAIDPLALAAMVNARRLPKDPKALEKMQRLADNPLLADPARITTGFALATIFDKRGETDTAWSYLSLANQLVEKQLDYDPERFSRDVTHYRNVFTKTFFSQQPPIRKGDRTPVFVVGMPRSGTTLTEQILCSHPDIFGAGELDLIARLIRVMPRVVNADLPYPFCLDKFTPHLREEAARYYLFGLYSYDRTHPYVVDKMPHNFMHLGLISLIFPAAKIVHVQRDPRDTALSNFQQNFKARHGGLGYAFNLEKIARQINDYHRMMDHWREVLPLPMFEFHYEDLVADQDAWSRRLLEFVGVEWDCNVRDFHKTKRAVRTASVTQVRQPIYKTSKQKWRRYEKHLAPLLENLDPEIMVQYDM